MIGIASGLLGPTIGELYHGINKDVTDFGFFFMCRGISWGVGSGILVPTLSHSARSLMCLRVVYCNSYYGFNC